MMKKEEELSKRPHTLRLEDDRKKLFAAGVLDVEGFDEETVTLMLSERKMIVRGKALRVLDFSKESGELALSGEVESVSYLQKLSRRAGFFQKLIR